MTHRIQKICIVGAGFMGTQIALQCAAHGCLVCIQDIADESLALSETELASFLNRMIADGCALEDQRHAILDRVSRLSSLAVAVNDADLVIEAVREDIDVKRDVFRQLDDVAPTRAILATNSSSIRISRVESATQRADRVLNTHFVTPVWKHPFVELMRGSATSDDTIATVEVFMKSIGVIPVIVRKESTGFVFNRIWRAVKKESLKVVDQGIASVEDVDRTWMIQMESPMGPMAMMDMIGLDVVRDIELIYYAESGDQSDAPPQILLDKIEAGELGVKTGKGFYTYPKPNWESPDFLR
jgi:3-hydroxybutyryl-CoA dehydrogenase